MVLFLFPKQFEAYKFVSHLNVNNFAVKEIWYNDYYIEIETPISAFRVMVIEDSDIGFNFKFMNLLNLHPEIKKEPIILIGSCGSANRADVGKMFAISTAIKGDRGKLDEVSKFTRAIDKQINAASSMISKKSSFKTKDIVSINFFNENAIDKEFNNCLFDMETYDFFEICRCNGVYNYSCFRFVTDYLLPMGPDNKPQFPEDHEKVKFDKLLRKYKDAGINNNPAEENNDDETFLEENNDDNAGINSNPAEENNDDNAGINNNPEEENNNDNAGINSNPEEENNDDNAGINNNPPEENNDDDSFLEENEEENNNDNAGINNENAEEYRKKIRLELYKDMLKKVFVTNSSSSLKMKDADHYRRALKKVKTKAELYEVYPDAQNPDLKLLKNLCWVFNAKDLTFLKKYARLSMPFGESWDVIIDIYIPFVQQATLGNLKSTTKLEPIKTHWKKKIEEEREKIRSNFNGISSELTATPLKANPPNSTKLNGPLKVIILSTCFLNLISFF